MAMAKSKLLFLSLTLSLLLTLGFSQQPQFKRDQCQIQNINPQQPQSKIQAEGGETEFYDYNNEQFGCAGVAVLRHRIRPRALLLPSYTSSPLLVYVAQGSGIHGIMASGCPETYESSQQSEQESFGRQTFRDRHQKIGNFRQGEIIAYVAGAAHWIYNNGNQDVVLIVLEDTSNNANQLDQNPRRFFLAGNPQSGQQPQQPEFGNVFKGFPVEVLVEAFRIKEETARKLKGENEQRGHIVNVEEGLQVISPPLTGQEEEQQPSNGLEETICSARVRQNIDNPSRADVFNPRAGRYTTANGLTLPILSFLQLSAARGILYKNAIMAPHWFVNCHSIVYATKGNARMQIVDHRGKAVFDGVIQEGQVVVVPHNFVAVKKAGYQGFEWVEFNTNDNAMISTLAGRTSALRALPVDVIANSYKISRQQAEQLKYYRRETLIFSGEQQQQQEGRVSSM